MTEEELAEFAASLGRHLATVLASEHGYAEVVCPDCRIQGKRRAVIDAAAGGACPTCDGMQRLWRKAATAGGRRLSDRQVIETLGARAA